jgi:predicted type IV restriction endonuclease
MTISNSLVLGLECAAMDATGQTRMSFETTLTDISARLRYGRFPNEQAISQGILFRVLQELGWDIWRA